MSLNEITSEDGQRHFIIMHEHDPSKELRLIPKDSVVVPHNLPQQTDVLWEIAQKVAETDSTFPSDNDIDDIPCNWLCAYCDGEQMRRSSVDDPFPHTQDCIVLKARELVGNRVIVKIEVVMKETDNGSD